jgi:selenocysteine lyase/cysteine desulfurase
LGGSPEGVVLTLNATAAINVAMSVLRKNGGRILISSFEHNAVYRRAAAMGNFSIFDASGEDDDVMRSFVTSCGRDVGLVVCLHQSNICSKKLPVNKIGAYCKKRGIPFVVDASQSLGREALSISECHADAICGPSHKGLYGIQGCGFIQFSDERITDANRIRTFFHGGNGVDSLETKMPDFLPERLEAGTLPTPAAASLYAGIEFVLNEGVENIAYKESILGRNLTEGLSVIKNAIMYGSEYGYGGTVLFNIGEADSETLSDYLDQSGFCVRGGYHCAPLGHRMLKTPIGGAVRVSFSVFNTENEVDRLLYVLNKYK